MSDPEKYLAEHEVKQNIFGTYGGQFGPFMLSTNRAILDATAKVLVLIGLTGYVIWETLSLSMIDGPTRWIIVGLLALLGLSTIHIILIRIYAESAQRALEPLVETEHSAEGEKRDQ